MTGAMLSVASIGGVHAGIVGMACIAFRFEQYPANCPSPPTPIKKGAPGKNASQLSHLSVHQNSMATPALNQRLARMNLHSHRLMIVRSHAHTVKQKANQKNSTIGMRTAAMRLIFRSA